MKGDFSRGFEVFGWVGLVVEAQGVALKGRALISQDSGGQGFESGSCAWTRQLYNSVGLIPSWADMTRLVGTIASGAKTYVTCDSRVVPHRSTEQAQWCLTSEFGRDLVLSPWYERMMGVEYIKG